MLPHLITAVPAEEGVVLVVAGGNLLDVVIFEDGVQIVQDPGPKKGVGQVAAALVDIPLFQEGVGRQGGKEVLVQVGGAG